MANPHESGAEQEFAHPGELERDEMIAEGLNPDRVLVVHDEKPVQEIESFGQSRLTQTGEHYTHHPGQLEASLGRGASLTAVAGTAAIAAVIGTVGVNLGTEHEHGVPPTATTEHSVQHALETVNMETFVRQVQKEVCDVVDIEFMHRFATKNASGREEFNPGGFIVPFAVELAEHCKAKVDVEIHIPYHFARTFKEISVLHPDKRDEMVGKLAGFIKQQVENRFVAHGIAGLTETTLVYDRVHGTQVQGKIPAIDLGNFDVTNFAVTGEASTEAEVGKINAGKASVEGVNYDNIHLAKERLTESMPLIKEAFTKAGVDPIVLKNIKQFQYEHNLIEREVHELAEISRALLGGVVTTDDALLAYQLIEEVNKGNSAVIKAIESDPLASAKFKQHVTDHRGVTVGFEAATEYNKTEVYNIVLPLPLLLLLLPTIRLNRVGGFTEVVQEFDTVETPVVIRENMVDVPKVIARRLFSETTPNELDKSRSFNEVYDEVKLSERPMDTRLLLEHMLLEEVLPGLYEETREPMIDYEKIVNDTREYLQSDARRGEVKKGSYDTTEEAERKMTEQLLSMWERHDAETYPMHGIDIKEVINYRHSPEIVYWAKTLAYHLTDMAKETLTSDQFRERLLEAIGEMRETRNSAGGSDRNRFVKSTLPLS